MGADRTKLKDLDFADGIVLIDESRDSMQELAAKVESQADKIGLRVNGDKCKVMTSSMCEREKEFWTSRLHRNQLSKLWRTAAT